MTEASYSGVVPVDEGLSLEVSYRGGVRSYGLSKLGASRAIDEKTRHNIDSWIEGGLWLAHGAPFSDKLACLADIGEILIGIGVDPGGTELLGLLGAYNLLAHECAQQFANLAGSLSANDRNFWRFQYTTKMIGLWQPVTMWPMGELIEHISAALVLSDDDIADPLGLTVDEAIGLETVFSSLRPTMAAQASSPNLYVKDPDRLAARGLGEVSMDIVELGDNGEMQRSYPWETPIETLANRTSVARRVVIRIEPVIGGAFAELVNAWKELLESSETDGNSSLRHEFVSKYVGLLSRTLPSESLENLLSSVLYSQDPTPPLASFHVKCRFTYGSRDERRTAEVGFRLERIGSDFALVALLPPITEPLTVEVEMVDEHGNIILEQIQDSVNELNPPIVRVTKNRRVSSEIDRNLDRSLEVKISEMNERLIAGDFNSVESLAIEVYLLRQALGQKFGNQ